MHDTYFEQLDFLTNTYKVLVMLFLVFLFLVQIFGTKYSVVFWSMSNSATKEDEVNIRLLSFPYGMVAIFFAGFLAILFQIIGISPSVTFLGSSVYITNFWLDFLLVLSLTFMKNFLVYISGQVLEQKNIFTIYNTEMMKAMSLVSVISLFLIFISLFYFLNILIISSVFFVVFGLFWIFRIISFLLKHTNFNFSYFFSYLCTLEVLPILVFIAIVRELI